MLHLLVTLSLLVTLNVWLSPVSFAALTQGLSARASGDGTDVTMELYDPSKAKYLISPEDGEVNLQHLTGTFDNLTLSYSGDSTAEWFQVAGNISGPLLVLLRSNGTQTVGQLGTNRSDIVVQKLCMQEVLRFHRTPSP